MYKIHVVLCPAEETSYIDIKKKLIFFSSVYKHTVRKFMDASFALKLDCSIIPAAAFELADYSQEINADVDDIIIFTTPFTFLAPAKEIEAALDYVIRNDLSYATVGSMRSLYACIGTGKMLTDGITLCSPYDFIDSIGKCGAKCNHRDFCESEKAICDSNEEYRDRLARYKNEYYAYLEKRGVIIENRHTVVVSPDSEIGYDTILLPNTQICAGSKIGSHCVLGPSSVISDSTLGNSCVVNASHIYNSRIEAEATIGPFSHVDRSQTLHKVKIGAYTEVRRCEIGAFSEIETHSLIAHCKTGPRVTIGSHVACANINNDKIMEIKISDDAIIGSGTVLVAPVTIGQSAFTAAGSTITDNVPAGSLGIAREYQTNHDGWARRRRK